MRNLNIARTLEEVLDFAGRRLGTLAAWFCFVVAFALCKTWLDQQNVQIYVAGLLGCSLLVSFVQYSILQALLRSAGYDPENSNFAAFLGLLILSTLGFFLGLIALIVPAFILVARWSLALPILLVEGLSPGSAIGASWDRTRGNTISLLLCFLPLFLLSFSNLWFAYLGLAKGIGPIVVGALLSGFGAVYLICISIVLYRSLPRGGPAKQAAGETTF